MDNIITKQYIFLSKRVKVVNSHEKFQCRMVSKQNFYLIKNLWSRSKQQGQCNIDQIIDQNVNKVNSLTVHVGQPSSRGSNTNVQFTYHEVVIYAENKIEYSHNRERNRQSITISTTGFENLALSRMLSNSPLPPISSHASEHPSSKYSVSASR